MSEITVCVKQKCTCGQEWEQTILIKKDDTCKLELSSSPPDWHDFYRRIVPDMELPRIPSTKLILTGHIERLSVEGMDASNKSIRCSKCGEDLLFMGRGDIEGIDKVHPKE